MTRYLIIQVIREVVRGWPMDDVQVCASSLPAQVSKGASRFCEDNELGRWFQLQIMGRNISVASELYKFIDESKQAVVQRKEAEASGDNNNAAN